MTTQRAITDDLELLLEIMPAHVREAVEAAPDRQQLLEVVLDLGRVPEARFPDRVFEVGERPVSRAELSAVVERVGRFGADNRAGIERTLHRISAIRNREGAAIGLTCRVGRAVIGTVDILRDVIEDGRSILLLGRPGVGKTTLLREAARVLADDLGKRVVVVDTSNEIAGDGDIPHPGIGRARRMQVPSPDRQHAVMIEAVENHMPEVIVIDEIGTGAEALAARTIAERGVQLIATAHGNDLDNLLQNPTLSDLVGGIHAVTLSDEEARRRRTQKTVLERKAPPTFDVVVEIQERDRLAVHHEIALVVDRHLRGEPLRPERRVRTDRGEVEIKEPVPDAPQPAGTATLRPERKILKIFPYAISKEKLLQAIETLDVPAYLVEDFSMADVLLTVKAQDRRQPRKLRDARERGVRIDVVRSNSVGQLEKYLRRHFGIGRTVDPHTVPDDEDAVREAFADDYEAALQETEGGIDQVLDRGHPVELSPQDRPIRRLQHEMVERAGLVTRSKGTEPYRRVVIYPR